MENQAQPASKWWKRPMPIVGGVTAVLGLVFGLQQLVGFVSDWHGRRQSIAGYVAVAAEQRASRHYAAALASLDSAARLDENNADVRTAQEDLAMDWLRNTRVHEGGQTFTDLVAPLIPVLERGALRAKGSRKADLIAHTGWADFLRWRDGARELAPDVQYRRALEIDPANPFAHAMWAHWIVETGGDAKSAQAHFDAAARSGREQKYVRSMQMAAALNADDDDALMNVANRARLQDDPVDGSRVFWSVCISTVASPDSWTRAPTGISMAEQIATLRWLVGSDSSDAYRRDMLHFCEARAYALNGNTRRALGMLRDLEKHADGDATRARAGAAADRLAK